MKLDFIEVCGFRGFRDKLRVDFASGFTVISGRNGVGKSTVCDAIEFGLTGEIDKYRVEKAAKETFSDYIWWRGEGVPEAHYVHVGFLGNEGRPFTIKRTRESGPNKSPTEIEAVLCAGAKPEHPLQQLCRTSILRDEWIAALSLDLTETERFDLVRAALGTMGGPDYVGKAREVMASTEASLARAQGLYEDARVQVTNALTQLAEARDRAGKAGDVADALARLEAMIGSTDTDLLRRITAAREKLSVGRMRLNGVTEAISQWRELKLRRVELDGAVFQQRKSAARQALEATRAEASAAQAEEVEARRRFETEQEADGLAASLSALVEHGSRIGLDHRHCPLCAAVRTETEFAQGLALARARMEKLGSRVPQARRALTEAQKVVAGCAQRLLETEAPLAEITKQEEALRRREVAYAAFIQADELLDPEATADPESLERYAAAERDRLIDLERAILTLEASHAVDRITDLEGRVVVLREDVARAADRLSRAQASVTAAKNIERGVRRASSEIIDERLALISPLLNELYQRLRPHAEWRSIDYSIRGDVRRFLSLKVGDGLNPQFVFSSGQRRAAGLAFLLSVHLSRSWSRLDTLVLDDPVQHIDDFRALHLVEVLAALRHDQRQIICAVEDASLADLLCRRLISTVEAPGRRYDIELGSTGGSAVAARRDVAPPPIAVLRLAAAAQAAG